MKAAPARRPHGHGDPIDHWKHMREAAERRQQLVLEHEQAVVELHTKQEEIAQLQRAQVRAKRQHEGAVHLLEGKVCELEEKCRRQSEQFTLLSQELERFRLQTGKMDLLGTAEGSGSSSKTYTGLVNGLAPSFSLGTEGLSERSDRFSTRSPSRSRSGQSSPHRSLPTEGDTASEAEDLDPDPVSLSWGLMLRHRGKLQVFVARYSYNPFEGPNEHPEAELPLTAGEYLYVYGEMDEDGFYEGELVDGRRGLVPSNFVERVRESSDDGRPALLDDDGPYNFPGAGTLSLGQELSGDFGLRYNSSPSVSLSGSSPALNGLSVEDGSREDADDVETDPEYMDIPYPHAISVVKQLAKSAIIAWELPRVTKPAPTTRVDSYLITVNGERRAGVRAGSRRPRALLEKLDLSREGAVYRVCVQVVARTAGLPSTTQMPCNESDGPTTKHQPSGPAHEALHLSDPLRCCLTLGQGACVAPSQLTASQVTSGSAELSWLPSHSEYAHAVFVCGHERDIVRAGRRRCVLTGLRPATSYSIRVEARPRRTPWELTLAQREKRDATVGFSTLPAGTAEPPQVVEVRTGPSPGSFLVRWTLGTLDPAGMSTEAPVTGYAIYADGRRIMEVASPVATNVVLEPSHLQGASTHSITVRTLSSHGDSVDSAPATLPCERLKESGPHTPASEDTTDPRPASLPSLPETNRLLRPDHPHSDATSPGCLHLTDSSSLLSITSPSHRLLPPTSGLVPFQGPGATQQPPKALPRPDGGLGAGATGCRSPRKQEPAEHRIPKTIARATEAARRGDRKAKREAIPFEAGRVERRLEEEEDGEEEEEEEMNSEEEEEHYDHPPLRQSRTSVDDFLKESSQEMHYLPAGSENSETCYTKGDRKSRLNAMAEEYREPRYGLREAEEYDMPVCEMADEYDDLQNDTTDKDAFGYGVGEHGTSCYSSGAAEGYTTESSRGSDLSDILEEDEEEEAFMEPGRVRDDHHARRCSGVAQGHSKGFGLTQRRRVQDKTEPGRRSSSTRNAAAQPKAARPLTVPSIEITGDSNCEGRSHSGSEEQSEGGHLSPDFEKAAFFGASSARRHRETLDHRRGGTWACRIGEHGGRAHEPCSEGSPPRLFVALFDYNPATMSPNLDALEIELPFKEGQIIRVFGEKDGDGFYRGEVGGCLGFVPCNMVSEIQADANMAAELFQQGYLPANSVVERKERTRKGSRDFAVPTRRMVALYDYDPRESSPNPDIEMELTFCAGDIIMVYGEMDEDGFYFGELNGVRGLVPSNFLEEVPADVEVTLSEVGPSPPPYGQRDGGHEPPRHEGRHKDRRALQYGARDQQRQSSRNHRHDAPR
uniref:RIMS-binding protein 2 isoform X2 n=1 Tax=Myxine glutinosa TaxID=7769 RepID=UPI00358DE745